MNTRDLDEAACLADFLQMCRVDAERGGLRELPHYLAHFPGREALLAREYAALREGGAGAASLPSLDGYRVLRELGRGGQGTVYLAEDLALHRPVALKVVHTALGRPSATQLARLEREATALARLDHPGICAVYRAHLEADPPCVAMRYVPGPTLAELLDAPDGAAPLRCAPTGREELERLLRFFEDAARALHAAHEAGIVHRDVKPGNLVCASDGRPVLLDFGLARPLDEAGPALTRTGDLFGTPAYMSPEQLLGAVVDRRTDVYSLGVTLHEALTRRRPFDAPSQRQLERAICEEPPPRASRVRPGLPADLDVLLAAALDKEPQRRYATALDLAEDLRRVRERRPPLARPPGRLLRARRWAQRSPVVATALGLLLLGSLLLATALVQLAAESGRTRAALRLAESRTLAASALTLIERDPVAALAQALAADELQPGVHSRTALYGALAELQVVRQVELPTLVRGAALAAGRGLFAGVTAIPGWTGRNGSGPIGHRVYVVDLADGRPLLDVELPSRGVAVALSASADWLAVSQERGPVLVFEGLAAEPRFVLAAGPDVVRALAISPDGTLLASGGDDDRIHLWDLATGCERAVLEGSLGPPCGLAFSPDGRLLASWVQERPLLPDRPDPVVRVWDVAAARPALELAGHAARVTVVRFSPDGRLLASASDDGSARLWDLPDGNCRAVLEHPGGVLDVAFDPAGQRLATAFDPGSPVFSRSGGLRIHAVADGALLLEPRGHEARPVTSLDWHPDGRRLASGSNDGTTRVWDGADGRQLACVRSTHGQVFTVRWAAGGAELLACHRIFTLVARADGDAGIPRLDGHAASVAAVAFAPDGQRLATGDTAGLTLVHDVRGGPPQARWPGDPAAVCALAWVDPLRLLVGSGDGAVALHHVAGDAPPARRRLGDGAVTMLRLLPGGATAVAASGANLTLLAVDDLRVLQVLRGHAAEVCSLDVSTDGRWLASGGADRTTRLWDLSSGACVRVLDDWLPEAYETETRVWSVLFHADGRGILTASEDGLLREYALADGALRRTEGPNMRVGRMQWLDGDHGLLMAQWQPTLIRLELGPLRRAPLDLPLVGRLLAMDIARDGSLALASSTDGTTLLLDAASLQPYATVGGHAGPVTCAAFSPDGALFVTASADGSVRLWPSDVAAAARARQPATVLFGAR